MGESEFKSRIAVDGRLRDGASDRGDLLGSQDRRLTFGHHNNISMSGVDDSLLHIHSSHRHRLRNSSSRRNNHHRSAGDRIGELCSEVKCTSGLCILVDKRLHYGLVTV